MGRGCFVSPRLRQSHIKAGCSSHLSSTCSCFFVLSCSDLLFPNPDHRRESFPPPNQSWHQATEALKAPSRRMGLPQMPNCKSRNPTWVYTPTPNTPCGLRPLSQMPKEPMTARPSSPEKSPLPSLTPESVGTSPIHPPSLTLHPLPNPNTPSFALPPP